jgi:hypothetical protein
MNGRRPLIRLVGETNSDGSNDDSCERRDNGARNRF